MIPRVSSWGEAQGVLHRVKHNAIHQEGKDMAGQGPVRRGNPRVSL